jgi:hypothetical protein
VRSALFYGFALVAIYLGVSHATGGGRLLREAGSATSQVVKTFQGR